MPSENLQVRYTGRSARTYDADRVRSVRWQAEERAFTELFESLAPRSVLDCPVGTGRWFNWYRGLEGPVIGLDKSQDMLDEARGKLQPDDAFELVQADVFTHDFASYQTRELDLVVCIRLLNWFAWADARAIVERLTEVGSPNMIVGITLRMDQDGRLKRVEQELKLRVRNARAGRHGLPAIHVHREREVLAGLRGAGWSIVRRTAIFHTGAGQNVFLQLAR